MKRRHSVAVSFWLMVFIKFFAVVEYTCFIVDKWLFKINVALYKSSLKNAAMDTTIGPCVARPNTFSSLLLCCESSCSNDAVCIYSNWLVTCTDVLQTFFFFPNDYVWYGVDWEKPILPSSNWDILAAVWRNRASLYYCMYVCSFATNGCIITIRVNRYRTLLSILSFLRWRQSCAGVDSCTAEFSGSSSTCRCTDGWLLPASGAQCLCSKNHRSFFF